MGYRGLMDPEGELFAYLYGGTLYTLDDEASFCHEAPALFGSGTLPCCPLGTFHNVSSAGWRIFCSRMNSSALVVTPGG